MNFQCQAHRLSRRSSSSGVALCGIARQNWQIDIYSFCLSWNLTWATLTTVQAYRILASERARHSYLNFTVRHSSIHICKLRSFIKDQSTFIVSCFYSSFQLWSNQQKTSSTLGKYFHKWAFQSIFGSDMNDVISIAVAKFKVCTNIN